MIGAILAGGRGKRFGGNKLLYKVNGRPLILHTIERLEKAREIDEIVLIASEENAKKLRELGCRVLVDELLIGPIGGVYTALSLGDAFVVAGDMPLIVPEFVDFLISKFRESGKIACVPRWENGYLEPLHTPYSRTFRKLLEEKIKTGNYALNQAIREVSPCYISIESLPEEWRGSFFNVNTKRDLEKVKQKYRGL
ncbi:molybdenum cofactor guanylyltransferase MobA [Thermococcus sp.]